MVLLTPYVHLIYSFYKYCFIPLFVTFSVDVATKPCFFLRPFAILKMFGFAVELRVSLLRNSVRKPSASSHASLTTGIALILLQSLGFVVKNLYQY